MSETETEKRLAEATAMLRNCRSQLGQMQDRLASHNQTSIAANGLLVRLEDFLSATPSPTAEPAPSLVDQIEAAINKLEQWCSGPDELEQTRESALRILRAAREAGGR